MWNCGRHSAFALRVMLAWLGGALLTGCVRPNAVTIQLRKDKQELQGRLAETSKLREADRARIADLEKSVGTLPTLPQDRLDRMFTVHGIELSRLTGGADLDESAAGDEGMRVYLSPVDETGDPMKATGSVLVEAFDLASDRDNRIGRWEFGPTAMKETWRGLGPLHAFVLVCPWQGAVRHAEVTVKVAFRDELTGWTFTALRDVHVALRAAATGPAARPQR